jgi:3-oxoacyl-[acyl-carrier protein] reductase
VTSARQTGLSARPPLTGLVAVVTGAAKGIGLTIARTLHQSGASVALIDQHDCEDLTMFDTQRDRPVTTWGADVTNETQVDSAFRGIWDHHGQIDLLINNAGAALGLPRKPFWELTSKEWDYAMAVNAKSVFLCSRSAVKPMMRSDNGRIVNIASDVVASGVPNWLNYVASKAAVIGITRSMAADLASNRITVNAVAPGLTGTADVRSRLSEEYRLQIAQTQMIKDPIQESDVAGAVAYLCSPAARLITGQTIMVNGGRSAIGL